MGEFKDSSLWIKLAMLFTVLAFALDLYGMDTPGWSTALWQGCGSKHCDRGWYGVVEVQYITRSESSNLLISKFQIFKTKSYGDGQVSTLLT